MIGATCRITHQNVADYWKTEVEQAFDVKDSENGGYREVYLAKEGNTGRLFIGVGGNRYTLVAELNDVAKRTFLAFLGGKVDNEKV